MTGKESRIILPIFIILLSSFPGRIFSQNMVFQSKRLQDGSYSLTGTLTVPAPAVKVSRLLKDFHHYSRWALKGLDGKDPVSAQHIGIFRDFRYSEKNRTIILIYDINLFWPFGARNKEFPLYVTSLRTKDNILESYTLTFIGSSTTIRSMILEISLESVPEGSLITIGVTIK